MYIPPWLWFSITTTLPQFGQFLAGNRFAEDKATKLSSAWASRHEEVLKVPCLRTVVVILVGCRQSVFCEHSVVQYRRGQDGSNVFPKRVGKQARRLLIVSHGLEKPHRRQVVVPGFQFSVSLVPPDSVRNSFNPRFDRRRWARHRVTPWTIWP